MEIAFRQTRLKPERLAPVPSGNEYPAPSSTPTKGRKLCHFTSSYRLLKSRSFHMEFVPLASQGFEVSFMGPHALSGLRNGVRLIPVSVAKGRVLKLVSTFRLLPKLLAQRADLYHFQDPELLPVGLVLKILFRCRVVYDAYEDFPSMVYNSRWVAPKFRPLLHKAMSALEALAAHCLDGIMTADPFTIRRLARVGRSKKVVFFNFPNLAFFPRLNEAPKRFDLVYRGGLSERTGVFILVDVIHRLAKLGRPARLSLIGYFDGADTEKRLREKIQALGLNDWVEIRYRIDHEFMASALSAARIGVCPLEPVAKFLLNIPVKVFEYWACGLPVIATDLPPLRPFFRQGKYGFLVKPGDPEELLQAVKRLLDDPGKAAQMGQWGREAVVERFNNATQTRKLCSFFDRIISSV